MMMPLRRLFAALTGAAVVVACLLVAPGQADAAVAFKIASPTVEMGCGGGDAYPLNEMVWGPQCEMVTFPFSGSTVSKKDTYKVSVSPKPAGTPYFYARASSAGRGTFATYADVYKVGTRYTFTIREYSAKKLVATAKSAWTPTYVKGPKRGYNGAPSASNGVSYYVAGKTYSLSFAGSWEAGTKIHAEVAVVDHDQTYQAELLSGIVATPPTSSGGAGTVGDQGQHYKAYKPGQKISFTVPADYTGGWIIVSLVGEKSDKLWWGFVWDAAQIVPNAQTAPQRPLTDTELGRKAGVTYPGSGDVTTGTVLTFQPKLPATSKSLGITCTYQWYRETYDDSTGATTDTDIDGATSPTYTVTAADVGAEILVRVTYTPTDPDYAATTRVFGGYVDGPAPRR